MRKASGLMFLVLRSGVRGRWSWSGVGEPLPCPIYLELVQCRRTTAISHLFGIPDNKLKAGLHACSHQITYSICSSGNRRSFLDVSRGICGRGHAPK